MCLANTILWFFCPVPNIHSPESFQSIIPLICWEAFLWKTETRLNQIAKPLRIVCTYTISGHMNECHSQAKRLWSIAF